MTLCQAKKFCKSGKLRVLRGPDCRKWKYRLCDEHEAVFDDSFKKYLARFLSAVILSLVIQACSASSPPSTSTVPHLSSPMEHASEDYHACLTSIVEQKRDSTWFHPPVSVVKLTDGNQQRCFAQAIQMNHLTLPAATTPEQVLAKYRDCMRHVPGSVSVGLLGGDQFTFNEDKLRTSRANCFASAFQ